MNAKKAKQLRKVLRQVEAAQKAEGKDVTHLAYIENENNRKYTMVPKAFNPLAPKPEGEADSEPKLERVQIAPGTIRVAPNTMRGFYHMLKGARVGKNLSKQGSTTTTAGSGGATATTKTVTQF